MLRVRELAGEIEPDRPPDSRGPAGLDWGASVTDSSAQIYAPSSEFAKSKAVATRGRTHSSRLAASNEHPPALPLLPKNFEEATRGLTQEQRGQMSEGNAQQFTKAKAQYIELGSARSRSAHEQDSKADSSVSDRLRELRHRALLPFTRDHCSPYRNFRSHG